MADQPLRVDIDLSLSEILKATNGTVIHGDVGELKGIALDTRAIKPGDLFVALKAVRDGHDFINDAVTKGASAVLVHKEVSKAAPAILVRNTTEALSSLGRFARKKWGKKVVAISGSNGKTTTKEMTAGVLSAHFNVHKTPGTWNNSLGMPLTLLMLRPHHEVVVLELGINHPGEMKDLCDVCEPNIGVLTNVGPVHLEFLGSLDGVKKAKGELFEGLSKNGTAVINIDDSRLRTFEKTLQVKTFTISVQEKADLFLHNIEEREDSTTGITFQYGDDAVKVYSPFLGVHNVQNLFCALAVAKILNVPKEKLQSGMDQIVRPPLRLEVIEASSGIRVVNDCYNANPGSMAVALEVARKMSHRTSIAALGDMLELGEFAPRAHREVGMKVASLRYDYLFVYGRYSGDVVQGAVQGGMSPDRIQICQNHQQMAEAISDISEPESVVLVKGSRGMKLEQMSSLLVESLRRSLG